MRAWLCWVAACLLSLSGHAAIPQQGQRVTMVILVRHAEREPLSTPDPPLTAAGKARAGALSLALRDFGIESIIVTQFSRTAATAHPLADVIGVRPEVIPDTGAEHARDVARAILQRHRGQTILVVGHGHTIPAIIRALGATGAEEKLCESQYDLMFTVLVPESGPVRVARARYGAASPADNCSASTALLNRFVANPTLFSPLDTSEVVHRP